MKKFRIGQHVKWQHGTDGYGNAVMREGYVVARRRHVVTLLALDGYRYEKYNFDWPFIWAGDKPDAIVVAGRRSDNRTHYAIVVGRRMVISAGCRRFKTLKGALNHWATRRRQLWAYDKEAVVFLRNRAHLKYRRPESIKVRTDDKRYNRWSIAFAKKVERIRTSKR